MSEERGKKEGHTAGRKRSDASSRREMSEEGRKQTAGGESRVKKKAAEEMRGQKEGMGSTLKTSSTITQRLTLGPIVAFLVC